MLILELVDQIDQASTLDNGVGHTTSSALLLSIYLPASSGRRNWGCRLIPHSSMLRMQPQSVWEPFSLIAGIVLELYRNYQRCIRVPKSFLAGEVKSPCWSGLATPNVVADHAPQTGRASVLMLFTLASFCWIRRPSPWRRHSPSCRTRTRRARPSDVSTFGCPSHDGAASHQPRELIWRRDILVTVRLNVLSHSGARDSPRSSRAYSPAPRLPRHSIPRAAA